MTKRAAIFAEIDAERERQDSKYGGPEIDDCIDREEWVRLIRDHALQGHDLEPADSTLLGRYFRRQMIRVAALAVAAIEAVDRESKL